MQSLMPLQGGFQEENVEFNEARLFEKIPYFQETPTLRNIPSFPVGAGGMAEAEPAGPDSGIWESTKVDLN